MKVSFFSFAVASATLLLTTLTTATSHRSLHRHRPRNPSGPTLRDAATTGYATLNGGTTGGAPGPFIFVSTLADLVAAVTNDNPTVVLVQGLIKGDAKIAVGSNKSIVGQDSNAVLEGIGLYIRNKKNVIIRNLTIRKVLVRCGDAVGIEGSTNVWVDHWFVEHLSVKISEAPEIDIEYRSDLSSDLNAAKGTYGGLLNISHGSDYVTVSHTYLHDHCKASVVGSSDDNAAEDFGKLHVTFHNNLWQNLRSRAPSVRFGTVHIYNSVYNKAITAIETRDGAQVLVERCTFTGVDKPIFSPKDSPKGYVVERYSAFGSCKTDMGVEAPLKGSLTSVPYIYSLAPANFTVSLAAPSTSGGWDVLQAAASAAAGASLSLLNVG